MSWVFISYAHDDRVFVRKLAEDLRDRGHCVWVYEMMVLVGDSLIESICEAIDRAEFVLAVISSKSLASEWVKKELDMACAREIREKRVVVLPILLESVQVPGFLRDKCYADFTCAERYEESLERLLNRLGSPTPCPDLSSIEMLRPYLFISTPSHGWLRVPLAELDELQIRDKISEYSYKDGRYAYLEEDDDVLTFIEAKERKHGLEYDLEEDSCTVYLPESAFPGERSS